MGKMRFGTQQRNGSHMPEHQTFSSKAHKLDPKRPYHAKIIPYQTLQTLWELLNQGPPDPLALLPAQVFPFLFHRDNAVVHGSCGARASCRAGPLQRQRVKGFGV